MTRMEMLRAAQMGGMQVAVPVSTASSIQPVQPAAPRTDEEEGIAYWTCPECAYEDNEMGFVSCERCSADRPPLEEFVPVHLQ